DLPAGLHELLVVNRQQTGVVVVRKRSQFLGGTRQGSELRIVHGSATCLVEGPARALDGEVARLGSETNPEPFRRVEDCTEPQAVRFRRLGFLDPVAGKVGGVVETG